MLKLHWECCNEWNSLIFFMLIAQGNGIVLSSITAFNRERALMRRERAKKMYRVLPFFLAKVISDMTNNILLPVVYGIITYWITGLRPSAVAFLKFLLGYYLSLSCAQSMGFFLSILYVCCLFCLASWFLQATPDFSCRNVYSQCLSFVLVFFNISFAFSSHCDAYCLYICLQS